MLSRITVIGILIAGGAVRADAADLLPGELSVDWGRAIVFPAAPPTVSDVVSAARMPAPAGLVVLQLHADSNNHYCPVFSPDGRSLALLKSDLNASTCKLCVYSRLSDTLPVVLFDDTFSFEHMPAWSLTDPPLLAFSSNNSENFEECIFVWDLVGEPIRATSGAGTSVLPDVRSNGTTAELIYRNDAELREVRLPLAAPAEATMETLGTGVEAAFSPGGDRIAVLREAAGQGHQLSLQDRDTGREVVLVPGARRYLRSPVWSPDGQWIAYLSRPDDTQTWSLSVVQVDGGLDDAQLAIGVRVQEDFRHVGPSWGPDSRRLWFVDSQGDAGRSQIRWVDIDGETSGAVEVPEQLLTASDVNCCRQGRHAAVAFVAVQDRSLDVYVMIMNHH